MNCNQKNSSKNDCNFFDCKNRKHKEECWHCRPCRNNFPPEIKWDCDDDEWFDKGFEKSNKDFDKNNDRDEKYYEDDYDYDYDKAYDDFDDYGRKEGFGKNNKCDRDDKDDKKDRCPKNHRPQCRCRRSCCGFFRIFHC